MVGGRIVKEVIPFLGTLLIVCGYIKLSLYYLPFNIRIYDYVEFTEILTLFLSDIIIYGVIISVIFLFAFLFPSFGIEDQQTLSALKKAVLDSQTPGERAKNYFRLYRSMIIPMVLALFASSILFAYDNFMWELMLFFSVTILYLLLFLFLWHEFNRRYREEYQKSLDSTLNSLVFTVVVFLLYIFASAYIEVQIVKNDNFKIVSFSYEEESISTNNQVIYLGQTQRYLFLYDKEHEVTRVFEREKISNLEIKGVSLYTSFEEIAS